MQYVEEKIPIKVHNFTVDSRLRDQELFPNPAKYVVDIETPYKNVIKVELVNAVYEKYGTENYLNLHIDELDGNLETNNNAVRGVFTQLPLILPLNVYNGGKESFRSVRLFERPLGKLARMTITFTNFDGTLYPMQDHLLRFEITCCKHEASIENRNLDLFSEHSTVYVPAAAPFPPPATPMSFPPTPRPPPATGKSALVPPVFHQRR